MTPRPTLDANDAIGPQQRVPAEWEPQECVWISWPHNHETWPGRFDRIPSFFARWVQIIAESVPVRVLAEKQLASDCRKLLGAKRNIELIDIPTNDCWIRDYGPTFVLNESGQPLSLADWKYNAWGGKYPPWDKDAAVCARLGNALNVPVENSELVVEGGALEFDGNGRLLTTTKCLLAKNRNPGVSQARVEHEIRRITGVTEIVWLDGGGLAGDDTDGHIDQLARFIDRKNIVACVSNYPHDHHSPGLNQNLCQLKNWAATTSPSMTVHPLPAPEIRRINNQPVPQSYCNFLRLGPDRVLVPQFHAPEDDHAAGLIHELTGASITKIDCSDLAWGLGALHCASRDQPRIPPMPSDDRR